MLEQLLCCQIARLPPIEDRLGDIRREIAEADRCRSDIEQCAEPTRAGPDVDTFDQSVKEGAPAYSGQLGQVFPISAARVMSRRCAEGSRSRVVL